MHLQKSQPQRSVGSSTFTRLRLYWCACLAGLVLGAAAGPALAADDGGVAGNYLRFGSSGQFWPKKKQ